MTTKTTPGPWRIGKTCGAVVADEPTSGGRWSGHEDVTFYGGHLVCESVAMESNARLIAAAPDLREACDDALTALDAALELLMSEDRRGRIMFVCDKVRAALANAEGRS